MKNKGGGVVASGSNDSTRNSLGGPGIPLGLLAVPTLLDLKYFLVKMFVAVMHPTSASLRLGCKWTLLHIEVVAFVFTLCLYLVIR